MAGAKWSDQDTVALINAYGERRVQEAVDGMVSNKEVYKEIQKIMKDESNVERTPKQIETKLKKLRSGYGKLKDRMKTSGTERPYFSSALSSIEKVALQHWDILDRILGTRPVNDPPAEHLFESESSNVEDTTDDATGISIEENGVTVAEKDDNTSKEKIKKIPKRPPHKKPRLTDALRKSSDQMEQLHTTLSKNIVTKEEHANDRKEDRDFFREMFGSLSQTMVGMAQMLTQVHNPGSQLPVYQAYQPVPQPSNHPSNQQVLHMHPSPYNGSYANTIYFVKPFTIQ